MFRKGSEVSEGSEVHRKMDSLTKNPIPLVLPPLPAAPPPMGRYDASISNDASKTPRRFMNCVPLHHYALRTTFCFT